MKVSVTIDDDRLKSNLNIMQTSIFTKRSFLKQFFGFVQSRFYPSNNIDGIYQLMAGLYKSEKPIKKTGIDKVHLKGDCINGSIVNSIREPILYSFVLSSPPGPKIYNEPKVKLF